MRIWIPLIHTFTNSFTCDIKVYILLLSYILFCLKNENIPLFLTDSINFKEKLFVFKICKSCSDCSNDMLWIISSKMAPS